MGATTRYVVEYFDTTFNRWKPSIINPGAPRDELFGRIKSRQPDEGFLTKGAANAELTEYRKSNTDTNFRIAKYLPPSPPEPEIVG